MATWIGNVGCGTSVGRAGTLELFAVSNVADERWRLEFELRGTGGERELTVTESMPAYALALGGSALVDEIAAHFGRQPAAGYAPRSVRPARHGGRGSAGDQSGAQSVHRGERAGTARHLVAIGRAAGTDQAGDGPHREAVEEVGAEQVADDELVLALAGRPAVACEAEADVALVLTLSVLQPELEEVIQEPWARGRVSSGSTSSAATLAVEADVRMAGVNVGKVKSKELDQGGARTIVEVQLDEAYAPVSKDSRAILRQKTLLGETYVELTPGNPRRAGTLPEGGTLPAASVSDTVELDEIFRAFDAETRQAFQTWAISQSQAVDKRARDLNDALGNLEPFAEDATDILRVLNSQEGAVRQVVRDTDEAAWERIAYFLERVVPVLLKTQSMAESAAAAPAVLLNKP